MAYKSLVVRSKVREGEGEKDGWMDGLETVAVKRDAVPIARVAEVPHVRSEI